MELSAVVASKLRVARKRALAGPEYEWLISTCHVMNYILCNLVGAAIFLPAAQLRVLMSPDSLSKRGSLRQTASAGTGSPRGL